MPCLSLMHRKIYRETVKKRVEARRLALAVQKKAAKAAKKATKQALKAAKQAEKAARRAAKAKIRAEKRAVQYPPKEAIAPSRLIAMPESAETTRNESTQTTSASNQSPLFRYISNSLQEFQEGVEVRIPHARRYISIAAPQATSEISGDGRVDFLRPSAVSVAYSVFPETIRSATSEGEAAFTRDGGLKERRVSEKQNVRVSKRFSRRPTRAELINAESSLGRTLFGSIPAGHRREFFHDRENVWIWYEGWTEADRQPRQMTVRYEVRPTGVYKKLSAGKYVMLEGNELENFRRAAHAYLQLIKRNLYHLA